ncbi:hypothetical protein PC128_g23206 [Phytophthora cactorum]|nr:hypothetical protein PC128_g23206 [Phytophthora cactorum]
MLYSSNHHSHRLLGTKLFPPKGEGGGKYPEMETKLHAELDAIVQAAGKPLDELIQDQDARLPNETLSK